jgi:hypothetical protein
VISVTSTDEIHKKEAPESGECLFLVIMRAICRQIYGFDLGRGNQFAEEKMRPANGYGAVRPAIACCVAAVVIREFE